MKKSVVYILLLFCSIYVVAQKSYVWCPTNQPIEPGTHLLTGENIDLVVFNMSEYNSKSKTYCANNDVSDALVNMVKAAYPSVNFNVLSSENYIPSKTSNKITIVIGILVYHAYPGSFGTGMWNSQIGYVANIYDYRSNKKVEREKDFHKITTKTNTYGIRTAKECLNLCYKEINKELFSFIDEILGRQTVSQQYAGNVSVNKTSNTVTPLNSSNPWRVYMSDPVKAAQYPPVGIPQQLHRRVIQAIYNSGFGIGMLNVVQGKFPPNTKDVTSVIGFPIYDGLNESLWLVKVDMANADRGWKTKNGLFLRQNIVALWEIMEKNQMASMQIRNRAYNSSKRISTSIAQHNLEMDERNRASQQYGHYVDEMYSGDFVKALDHYNEYEYHKKELAKMEEKHKISSYSYSISASSSLKTAYQFQLNNSVPFSNTEIQVIQLINRSGKVSNEVWAQFSGSLNQAQKQQLGLR